MAADKCYLELRAATVFEVPLYEELVGEELVDPTTEKAAGIMLCGDDLHAVNTESLTTILEGMSVKAFLVEGPEVVRAFIRVDGEIVEIDMSDRQWVYGI
jgi:hypothetical protein